MTYSQLQLLGQGHNWSLASQKCDGLKHVKTYEIAIGLGRRIIDSPAIYGENSMVYQGSDP